MTVHRLLFLIGLSLAAALTAYGTPLFIPAVITAGVAVWANGVVANFMPNVRRAPRTAILAGGYAALVSILLIIGGLGIRVVGAIDGNDSPSADRAGNWSGAKDLVGEAATVCGPVVSVVFDADGTFINVGAKYPDPDRFTVVVWNETFKDFSEGDTICASGRVSEYQGVAQLETHDPEQDLSRG